MKNLIQIRPTIIIWICIHNSGIYYIPRRTLGKSKNCDFIRSRTVTNQFLSPKIPFVCSCMRNNVLSYYLKWIPFIHLSFSWFFSLFSTHAELVPSEKQNWIFKIFININTINLKSVKNATSWNFSYFISTFGWNYRLSL